LLAKTGEMKVAALVAALADTIRPTKLRMQGTSSDLMSDGAEKFAMNRYASISKKNIKIR